MGRRPLDHHGWILLASLAACDHTVALGTECPPIGDDCIDTSARKPEAIKPQAPRASDDAGPDASPSIADGGFDSDDAAASDASAIPTSKTPLPDLQNPSLELTAGAPNGGGISAFSSVKISPWYSCSGSVSARPEDDLRNTPSGTPTANDLLHPSDQSTLVSLSFGVGPATLVQTLTTRLKEGQRYAFMIDVVRSGSADARLQVWGANGSCFPVERFAQSEMIAESTGWQSICFAFTPRADYRELVLMASPTTGARLFVDNIRSDARCE